MKRGTFALILMLLLTLTIFTSGCAKEEAISTPTPTQVIMPTPTAKQTPTPTVLLLQITQPIDGAQVSTSAVLVTGKTIPGAVVSVSIDDIVEIANVDQNGNFSVTVNLEEGPNLIEVIASDLQGNEKSSTIAVIYVP